jgi:hypothetical protein
MSGAIAPRANEPWPTGSCSVRFGGSTSKAAALMETLMRCAGLRGLAALPRRVRTTDSWHNYPTFVGDHLIEASGLP